MTKQVQNLLLRIVITLFLINEVNAGEICPSGGNMGSNSPSMAIEACFTGVPPVKSLNFAYPIGGTQTLIFSSNGVISSTQPLPVAPQASQSPYLIGLQGSMITCATHALIGCNVLTSFMNVGAVTSKSCSCSLFQSCDWKLNNNEAKDYTNLKCWCYLQPTECVFDHIELVTPHPQVTLLNPTDQLTSGLSIDTSVQFGTTLTLRMYIPYQAMYAEFTLGIQICGGETVTVTPGAEVFSLVASQTTTQIVFPVSSMNYFAISDPNCPAADYQLYSDAFGTPWTDTAKVKQDTSVTANSRMYPLVISQATAYSLITLYLGVKTKGGIMGYKQITVSVCQPATFPISPTPKKLMVKKLLPSQGEIPENVITFATVSDCQKTFSVTSDAAGATPSTSPLAYSVADVKFMIDTNAAVFTTVYAKVVTPATYDYFTKVYTYTTAIQPVEVTVCDPTVIVTTGTEVFSLVASQTVTQIVFPVSSMNYFTSSQNCPPVSFDLLKFDTSAWTDNRLAKLDSSVTANSPQYPLVISLQLPQAKIDLFLRATTALQVSGSKQISIEICDPSTSISADSQIPLVLEKNPNSVSMTVTQANQWFAFTPASSSLSCLKEYTITSDAAGTTPSSSPLAFDSGSTKTIDGMFPLILDRGTPIQVTRYLHVKTPAIYDYFTKTFTYTTVTRSVEVAVCGGETIAPTDATVFRTQHQALTGKEVVVNPVDIAWFKLTNEGSRCGLTKTILADNANGSSEHTLKLVKFDPAKATNLILNISAPQQTFSVFVVGFTVSGKIASKQIEVEICRKIQIIMASPPLYSYVHTYSIKSETVEFFNMFSATCALANYQLSVRNGTVYTQFLDPDIGFYEQSLTKQTLKINLAKMRGPTRLFATGTDPFGVKHYQEFTVMVCGADNFRWASKLNSTLLFEFRSTGQDFSMAYIEGLQDWIQIEVEGCMNRFELVTANGSLYNSTFVAISKDEKRIEVSNVVNNMVDLSIRATSPDGQVISKPVRFVVCGDEVIINPFNRIQRPILGKNSGDESKFQIVKSLPQFFKSNDAICPVTSFKLTLAQDGDLKYQPYQISSVSISGNMLQVDTSVPQVYEFNLMVKTMFNTIWQQYRVRVCGNEVIRLLENEPYRIEFSKKSTKLVLEKYDYQRFFSVSVPDCEIESYELAQNQTSEATQFLGKFIIFDIKTEDLRLNLAGLYQDQEVQQQTFVIKASTASKVVRFFKVLLFKQSCQFETVEVEYGSSLSLDFTYQSNFTLSPLDFSQFFKSSNPVECPIKIFNLANGFGDDKYLKSLKGFVFISDQGIVSFDFKLMSSVVPLFTTFYVAGSNENLVTDLLLVKLKKGKLAGAQGQKSSILTDIIMQSMSQNQCSDCDKKNTTTVKEAEIETLRIRATPVDFTGQTTLNFNHPLSAQSVLSIQNISSRAIDIRVYKSEDGQELELSWVPLSISESEIEIQIKFEQPLQVSTNLANNGRKDTMLVTVIDLSLFKAHTQSGLVALFTPETTTAIAPVSKQIKDDITSVVITDQIQNTQSTMNALMLAQFSLNLFIQVGLSQIIGTFHILQIVCFQTMMNIEYPANAQFAASTIIEILNADVLNPQLLHDLMFDFENDWDLERILETDERYFGLNIVPQIKDMGFQTFNPIMNLGGLFVVFLVVVLQFVALGLIQGLLKLMKRRNDSIQAEGGIKTKRRHCAKRCLIKTYKQLRRDLFWETPLVVVHEALIQISMSFLLFLQRPSHLVDSDSGINFTQIISSIFGYFCIVLIALYFLLVLKIATGKENELIRPQIRRKVGFIYSDLKPQSRSSMSISLLFFFRRLSLCMICLYLKDRLYLQFMFTGFMNLFSMILIVSFEPFILISQNRKELINEFLILQMTNILALFTDFANNREFQYDVGGWIYVGFLGVIIAFNLSFIVAYLFKLGRLICKKYYLRLKYGFRCKPESLTSPIPQPQFPSVDILDIYATETKKEDLNNLESDEQKEIKPPIQIHELISQNEEILRKNLKTCCSFVRREAMRQARLKVVESDSCPIQVIDPVLYNQERVKLYLELHFMKYQEVELSKFVEVQHAFYLKMAKKTKLEKIIGLNEFKVEKKLFIHNRFLKKVKKLVKQEGSLDYEGQPDTFEAFATSLSYNIFLMHFLQADGQIKPIKLQSPPSKYLGYKLRYHKDLRSKIVADCKIQKYLRMYPPEIWTSDKFRQTFVLSSEERSAYFEQSVSRRHIKSFYKISSEFIKWVTSNVAKESDEYEMRVKELDAEKQLALNLMLLAQKVKGQDNFITIVK